MIILPTFGEVWDGLVTVGFSDTTPGSLLTQTISFNSIVTPSSPVTEGEGP